MGRQVFHDNHCHNLVSQEYKGNVLNGSNQRHKVRKFGVQCTQIDY